MLASLDVRKLTLEQITQIFNTLVPKNHPCKVTTYSLASFDVDYATFKEKYLSKVNYIFFDYRTIVGDLHKVDTVYMHYRLPYGTDRCTEFITVFDDANLKIRDSDLRRIMVYS